MRSSFPLLAVTCLALAFSATAFADFGWQTTPILGTEVTYTGDVVVNTGPTPITIPHYSMCPGDPLCGVGSPSMTVFYVGQSIATGSGMWVNPGDVYNILGIFQQLTGGSRTTTYGEQYTATTDPRYAGFVMEAFTSVGNLAMPQLSGSPLVGLSDADIGTWSYTESWTNAANGADFQTHTNDFSVAAVPEPGALLLFGSVLLGLVAYRRKLA